MALDPNQSILDIFDSGSTPNALAAKNIVYPDLANSQAVIAGQNNNAQNVQPTGSISPIATPATASNTSNASLASSASSSLPWLNQSSQTAASASGTAAAAATSLPWLNNSGKNTTVTNTSSIAASFQDNVLDAYDNYTYHWRMSMAPQNQIMNPDVKITGPQYIIAESGVTASYIIKQVSMTSWVSPNNKIRTTTAAVFHVVIDEPQGITLVDNMLATATKLGISNIYSCPLLMELSFLAYNAATGSYSGSIEKRSYRVCILKMDIRLTEGGAEYSIDMQAYSDNAYARLAAVANIPQPMEVTGSTVVEFLNNLATAVNAIAKEQASTGVQPLNVYKFQVDADMASWRVGQTPTGNNAPSDFIAQDGKASMVLKPGMNISDVLDILLSTTRQANAKIKPDNASEQADQPPMSAVPKIYQINSKCKTLQYNAASNLYGYEYTYYITPYTSYRMNIAKPDAASLNNAKRLQSMVSSVLKKRYDYIFTGLNTSILRLDLTLNNLWAVANTAYVSGLQRTNNTSSTKIQPDTAQEQLADTLGTSSTHSLAFNANGSTSGITASGTASPSTAVSTLGSSLGTATQPSFQALSAVSMGETPAGQDLVAAIASGQIKSAQLTPSTLGGVANTAVNTAGSYAQTGSLLSVFSGKTANTPTQSSTASSGTAATLPWLTNAATSNQTQLLEAQNSQATDAMSLMYKQTLDPFTNTRAVNQAMETTTNLDRSIFGQLMNQMYDNMPCNNLVMMDMEIRGDPYWLGLSDDEKYTVLAALTQPGATAIATQAANYMAGDQVFLLTFNTPQTVDTGTGTMNLAKSTLFVGLYIVLSVESTFADGKFTQTLKVQRDTQTASSTLAKYIK